MRDLQASIEAAKTRQTVGGAIKVWEDLERYRFLIGVVGPDLIIETGTGNGASGRWFADTADCAVVTIDDESEHRNTDPFADSRVCCLLGSSTDPKVVVQVTEFAADYKTVMVVLDSDHSPTHVLAEMRAYGPLVTPGSYMVVEDGICRWLPDNGWGYGDGPLGAIDAYLVDHGVEWATDHDVEDLHDVTMSPDGWLRRL